MRSSVSFIQYLGLHPSVFKHTFTKATTHVTQAKEVASTLSILAPAFLAYTFGKKEAPVPSPIPATSAVPPPPVDEDTPITDAPAPTRVYANPFDGEDGGGDTHFRPPVVGVETQGRRGSTSSQKAALRRGSVDNQPTPKMVPASGGGWSRFSVPALYGLGTAAVAAAAAGAYVKRNDVGAGLNWAQVCASSSVSESASQGLIPTLLHRATGSPPLHRQPLGRRADEAATRWNRGDCRGRGHRIQKVSRPGLILTPLDLEPWT